MRPSPLCGYRPVQSRTAEISFAGFPVSRHIKPVVKILKTKSGRLELLLSQRKSARIIFSCFYIKTHRRVPPRSVRKKISNSAKKLLQRIKKRFPPFGESVFYKKSNA
jgi:hypothetical protein